jgi:hypothetical protein
MVRTSIALLIPAFALLVAPPVLAVWLLCDRTLPYHCLSSRRRKAIPSFGMMLEPRYVVGARALDQ